MRPDRPVFSCCFALAAVLVAAPAQDRHPTLSPFSALRWNGEAVEAQIDGKWWGIESIDGRAVGSILDFCEQEWPTKWRKRFVEDLVEVLTRMGRAPSDAVRIEVRDLTSGTKSELKDVPMTSANRRALWAARKSEPDGGPRSHSSAPQLARSDAEVDLDALARAIERDFSYAELSGFPYRAALDAIRAGLGERVGVRSFALQLVTFLNSFGDGHARLEGFPDEYLLLGYLPFLVDDCGGRLAAFRSDRSAWIDAEHPYITHIDGLPIDAWLGAAKPLVAAGSPALERYRGIRLLRYLQQLRTQLGRPQSPQVEVSLESEDGRSKRTVSLAISDKKPIYGEWPRRESGLLKEEIGYLRIARMGSDSALLDGIDRWMSQFRTSRGLIIDVRGNGGGSRDALLRLFPYFMAPDEPPAIVNVAALRTDDKELRDTLEGALADRFLFPAASARWSKAERAAINAFSARFSPKWKLPAQKFTPWHYLVLSRESNPKAYHYTKPTAILLDGGCFSATDIFLGAFRTKQQIKFVGSPSSGGSGRARMVRLPRSGLELALSSMASFRPDGSLYDGGGIEPDIRVFPSAADFVGSGDRVLEAALAALQAASKSSPK